MKETILYHGIPIVGRMPLFTVDNRQAIRDNLKTQTRRVIDPPPPLFPGWWKGLHWASEGHFRMGTIEHYPHGKVGDVRCVCEPLMRGAATGVAYYRDDWKSHQIATPVVSLVTGKPIPWRWKREYLVSLYMPTEAARTVRVTTDIRVEKLQEISEEDAKAEGVLEDGWEDNIPGGPIRTGHVARLAFESMWEQINHKRGYGWDVPQMVWVNSFKKLEV